MKVRGLSYTGVFENVTGVDHVETTHLFISPPLPYMVTHPVNLWDFA